MNDVTKILELVAKGMALVEALRQSVETISPALKAMYELVEKNQSGAEVTKEDLQRVEDLLDAQLSDFNEPLPEE